MLEFFNDLEVYGPIQSSDCTAHQMLTLHIQLMIVTVELKTEELGAYFHNVHK